MIWLNNDEKIVFEIIFKISIKKYYIYLKIEFDSVSI